MKSRILEKLRAEAEVVSGEALSAELGISRVSVWKHIRKLVECGYDIESTPRGYRLKSSPDALFSWEFPKIKDRVHYYEVADSTMDIAREMARNGCPDFTVVIAGAQKKGRGRLKRTWFSTRGGLYFTIVLRPQIPPALSYRLNFCASLALASVFREKYDVGAMVKWPNDILAGDRKLVGMLSEMEAESDLVSYVNIGIGINVNNDPTPDEPKAVSLREILGREVLRKDVLADFLEEFGNRLKTGTDRVISEWKEYTVTLNRMVKVATMNEVTEGFAKDVDEDGALILELPDGTLKKVIYGDCFISGM